MILSDALGALSNLFDAGLSVALLAFACVVLFGAGLIKGFIGLGLPTVSMALLTLLLDARLAVSLILVPMLASNIWQMLRGDDLRLILRRYWRFAVVLAICVGVTVWVTRSAPDAVLRLVLGIMLLVFAFSSWKRIVPEVSPALIRPVELIAATFAGVVGGLAAAWAGPMAMYLSARRVAQNEFVQALGFLISAGSLPLLLGYVAVGHASTSELAVSTALLVPTLLGYSIGEAFRRRTSPELFRKALLVVFTCLGVNLVISSLTDFL